MSCGLICCPRYKLSVPIAVLIPSVHAITAQISPVPNSSGIEVLETETFRLQCFQTQTYPPAHHLYPVNPSTPLSLVYPPFPRSLPLAALFICRYEEKGN